MPIRLDLFGQSEKHRSFLINIYCFYAFARYDTPNVCIKS